MVERVDNKGTAKENVLVDEVQKLKSGTSLHQTSSEEDDGVDNTNNPIIARCLVNAELLGERQVSTIGTCLIPALGSSADGTETN